jgi:hypothetical protein
VNIWTILGLAPTADTREIKRAYARKLKITRPEDDPVAFQALNEAYQTALRMAQFVVVEEEEEPAPEPEQQALATVEDEPALAPAWERPLSVAREEDEAIEEAWERPVAALREEAWERPVPALRQVPDENALRLAREQERERARAEARAASQAAFELARQLWTGFVERATVAPKHHLKQLLASDEMLNLEVREHFELFALQYCADEGCTDDAREAIATVFGWEEDAAFVGRRLPDATGEALARLRAGRDYHALLQRTSSEPALDALLAGSAGRRFGRTLHYGFTRQMQQTIAQIRAYHRELLHFRLNREVFEEWERRVAGRRYFLETFLLSVAAGIAPYLFCLLAQSASTMGFAPELMLAFLPLAVAAGFAWAHYDPLARMRNADWTIDLWHDLRYQPRWQLGWIPVYALLSTLMFVPDPPTVYVWLLGAALVGCALVASFANSVMLGKVHYGFGAVAALIFGGAMADKGFAGYGVATCIAGAYCTMQLFYRGGADLWSRMPARAGMLLPLRCAWLAGTLVLVLGADLSPLPPHLHGALCWLWIVGGMLLSSPTINPFGAAIGGLALVFGVVALFPTVSMLQTMPMSMLVSPLFGVAIFMVVNMIRAPKTQHPFS